MSSVAGIICVYVYIYVCYIYVYTFTIQIEQLPTYWLNMLRDKKGD